MRGERLDHEAELAAGQPHLDPRVVGQLAAENLPCQWRLDLALQHPLQGSCPVDRVVTRRREMVLRCIGEHELDVTLGEPFAQPLELDIDDAAQIRARYPDCVSIFLRASSLAAYEQRLRKRGTESEEAIRRRVAAAQRELANAATYDREVINDDLDKAVADLSKIVRQQFAKG